MSILGQNAPAAALFAALVESIVGLGVLFPGGTIVILAGFAARGAGAAGFIEVGLAAALGMTLGSIADYALGRVAGRRLIPRRAPWRLACRWRHALRTAHAFMARWGPWAIAAANLAGPGRSVIAVAAGATRWSFPRFVLAQTIASIGWGMVYAGLGYFAAGQAQWLQALTGGIGVAVVVVVVAIIAGPWLTGWLTRALVAALQTWTRPAPARLPETAPLPVQTLPVQTPAASAPARGPVGSLPPV
jgi:membrane protein DedA with SNARE-associated domain